MSNYKAVQLMFHALQAKQAAITYYRDLSGQIKNPLVREKLEEIEEFAAEQTNRLLAQYRKVAGRLPWVQGKSADRMHSAAIGLEKALEDALARCAFCRRAYAEAKHAPARRFFKDLLAAESWEAAALRTALQLAEQSVQGVPAARGAAVPAMAQAAAQAIGETGRESLTYLYAGTTISYLKIMERTGGAVQTVCSDYFDIDSGGNLLISPPEKISPAFIAQMHERGVRVTPFISNHWNRELGNAALDNAEMLAAQLAEFTAQYDLDGINVDIENVTEAYRDKYTAFVRILREKLPADKVVAVAVAANPNGWDKGWQGSYDYWALAANSDYLMVMVYDESYYGGPEGPVASAAFFEKSIQYALNQGVPESKIVVGLPFFGRFWREGDEIGGIGIAVNDIVYLTQVYPARTHFDNETKSAYAQVTIAPDAPKPKIWGGRVLEAGEYHIWYDDLMATRYKLERIADYGLRGAGSWALGQEDPAVWTFYSQSLNGGRQPEIAGPIIEEGENSIPPAPAYEDTHTPQQQIAEILRQAGDPREIQSDTLLTRGEIAVLLAGLMYLAPAPQSNPFADVRGYWGEGQVGALAAHGVVTGEPGGRYEPERNITREELAALLERVLVLPDTIDYHAAAFSDVEPGRWSYNAIAKLYYFDVMHGVSQMFFRPLGHVPAEDMGRVLARIEKYGYAFNPERESGVLEPRVSPVPVEPQDVG